MISNFCANFEKNPIITNFYCKKAPDVPYYSPFGGVRCENF